ncbi:gluconokinase [Luteolibacter yonseiensis]|uniref:Gluconokinase n=1 Tax=Luteolibacter yonseiensis TaxID=1144680 RepID=A0A934R577_9BACT|nr:gluconokinase [Luteolibacter yonseiensis]MBK1817169.1 gluconokinase [Luteolibacter yonseiensis]
MKKPRVVIVMGVSGSGKSTIGELLAERNGGVFHDADDFHPPANIAKMASGHPLDDEDRAPWLARLREEVVDATPAGKFTVLACSALKKTYREILGTRTGDVALVYLHGTAETLTERLSNRIGHFMKPGMLESQLATLEEPAADEGLNVSIEGTVDEILSSIESALGLHFPSQPTNSPT